MQIKTAIRICLLIAVSVVAQALILFVGVPIGAAAGYYGGWVDTLLMRIVDIFYAIPQLLLAILIMGVLGRGLHRAAFWTWGARKASES